MKTFRVTYEARNLKGNFVLVSTNIRAEDKNEATYFADVQIEIEHTSLSSFRLVSVKEVSK